MPVVDLLADFCIQYPVYVYVVDFVDDVPLHTAEVKVVNIFDDGAHPQRDVLWCASDFMELIAKVFIQDIEAAFVPDLS